MQSAAEDCHGLAPRNDETRETNIERVIPSAVEESPRSRPGQQRLQRAHSEEILRYTQDDSEEENKKNKDKNK